jgi:hypothetical protein
MNVGDYKTLTFIYDRLDVVDCDAYYVETCQFCPIYILFNHTSIYLN